MKKFAIAALAAAISFAPAHASTCWKTGAAEAAQVRNFEMMLMVSALRCRTSSNNFLPAYNRFVQEKRAALTEVNDALRAHFSEAVGQVNGLGAYDDYVISLANSYGAGVNGLICRDLEALTAAANALPADRISLLKLTDAAGITPRLNAARCSDVAQIAQAGAPAPVAPQAPAIAMATSAPRGPVE